MTDSIQEGRYAIRPILSYHKGMGITNRCPVSLNGHSYWQLAVALPKGRVQARHDS